MMHETMGDGVDHIRVLADEIGKRPTGFEGERRGAEYLCGRLREMGLADVGTEPFDALSWDYDRCEMKTDTGEWIDSVPVEFSGSTPAEGAEGELIVYESPGDVRYEEVAGKMVMVYGGVPAGDGLAVAGAAGLLVVMPKMPLAYQYIYGPERELVNRIPMVTVGYGDGMRMVGEGVRRVTLLMSTVVKPVTGMNVVGAIPGRSGRDDGRVLVSAHYDSVPVSGGASDNAAGTACALEVARALTAARLPGVVDVVIFSAEEIGLIGAAAYADRHADRLGRTRLGIYFDGQGDILGRHHIHILGQPSIPMPSKTGCRPTRSRRSRSCWRRENCGGNEHKTMKKTLAKLDAGEHVTLVALGDSITEITFHTRGHMNWVGLLSEALFERYGNGVCTLINSGKCGSSYGEALTRLDRDVLRYEPDLVILAFGMNDAGAGLAGLEDFKEQVRETIRRIRDACGSEILVRTPNPIVTVHGVPLPPEQPEPGKPWESPDRPLDSYAAALVELAGELDCAVVDHYRAWTTKTFDFRHPVADPQALWPRMGDAIHPGYLGHLAFFRELAPLFGVPTHFPWEEVTTDR